MAVGLQGEVVNSFLFQGQLRLGSRLVVEMAANLASMVAVARNPVTVQHARDYGAPGGLEQAYGLGEELIKAISWGGFLVAQKAAEFLGGFCLGQGMISRLAHECSGGLDVGSIEIEGLGVEMVFCYETILLRQRKDIIGKFPNLIALFDIYSGWPQAVVDLKVGQK